MSLSSQAYFYVTLEFFISLLTYFLKYLGFFHYTLGLVFADVKETIVFMPVYLLCNY